LAVVRSAERGPARRKYGGEPGSCAPGHVLFELIGFIASGDDSANKHKSLAGAYAAEAE